MATIRRLGERNDPGEQNVLATLHEAMSDIETGEISPRKALLIFLDDEDEEAYDPSFYNAGMAASEMIALAEVVKARFLVLMGFVNGD